MLKDAGHLNEREAEWENRKRERKGLTLIEPLYTVQDAQDAMHQFRGVPYGVRKKILPNISIRLSDAGHISWVLPSSRCGWKRAGRNANWCSAVIWAVPVHRYCVIPP